MILLAPDLELSPEHVYSRNGVPVPGVTTVLRLERLIDPRFFTPGAAQRGTAVHAAVEQDERGILDEAFLDPRIGGYLEGWRAFKRDHRYTVARRGDDFLVEVRMYSESLCLCGTADGVGHMDSVKGLALVDVKSGEPSPATALQTALYAMMFWEHTRQIIAARFAVQVKDDGTYKLHRYSDLNDSSVAKAVVNVHRWRALHLPAFSEHLESEAAA